VAALGSSPAIAGDPFEDARYYVSILDDAKVLAMVDGGQVSLTDTNPEGYTLLHYAADGNRLELVKALLQRGANPDARANTGSTPWDMATASSVKAVLKAAMKAPPAKPTPSAPSVRGNTGGTGKVTASADGKAGGNRADCNKKWKADYNLCSDTTCKMITYRKHAKCLKTGLYW
jgi:hypothetical protein